MPNKKIITAIILCSGIVLSTWLIFGKTSQEQKTVINPFGIVATDRVKIPDNSQNNKWRDLLSNVDTKKIWTTDLTQNSVSMPEDTTLTAQLSRDLFSNYLINSQSGEFNSNTANKIVDDVLLLEEYTEIYGAIYLEKNLNIVDDSRSNIIEYENTFNSKLREAFLVINSSEDPIAVLSDSLEKDNESGMSRIDPIIKANEKFISDLLAMGVPKKAVKVHLDVLNASSNTLTSLRAIRHVFVDPLKSLTAVGQYENHLNNLIDSLANINKFFELN